MIDTLSVILKDNVAVHESGEHKPGVILDQTFSMLRSESRTPTKWIFNCGISRRFNQKETRCRFYYFSAFGKP
jgi:hypothetical protein